MSEEQTNPETPAGANPESSQPTNPEGSQAGTATEPNDRAWMESLTEEQVNEWKKGAEANEATQAEFTRRSQELSEMRNQSERDRAALQALLGERAAEANPLVAAQHALQQLEVKQGMQNARKFGDYTEAQLSETLQGLTPEKLAMVRAFEEGRLNEVLEQQNQERELDRRKGDLFQSLMMSGEGSPRVGLGGQGDGRPTIMSSTKWYSGTTSQQQALLEDHPDLVLIDDNSPGEVRYMKPVVRGQHSDG